MTTRNEKTTPTVRVPFAHHRKRNVEVNGLARLIETKFTQAVSCNTSRLLFVDVNSWVNENIHCGYLFYKIAIGVILPGSLKDVSLVTMGLLLPRWRSPYLCFLLLPFIGEFYRRRGRAA